MPGATPSAIYKQPFPRSNSTSQKTSALPYIILLEALTKQSRSTLHTKQAAINSAYRSSIVSQNNLLCIRQRIQPLIRSKSKRLTFRIFAVRLGPDQAMPFNIEDTDLIVLAPIKVPVDLSVIGDRHTWDTIILCSLMNGLFGRIISSQEVADVINARDGRIR